MRYTQDIQEIREFLSKYLDLIFSKPRVTAVGIGYRHKAGERTDELCLVVNVKEKLPEVPRAEMVPQELKYGKLRVRTDVYESGDIRAMKSREDEWRPAPGGVSVGHEAITAGTLGCLLKKDKKIYIMSNNHVLANENEAEIGDFILQPGPYDIHEEEKEKYRIAQLSDFEFLHFLGEPELPECKAGKLLVNLANYLLRLYSPEYAFKLERKKPISRARRNRLDWAIAEPIDPEQVSSTLLELGEPGKPRKAELGLKVTKSGRTTGVTRGEITQLHVVTKVGYSQGTAVFEEQIATPAMCEGGDSGSLLVSQDGLEPVGLLFAGSDKLTLYNPIDEVLKRAGGEILSNYNPI